MGLETVIEDVLSRGRSEAEEIRRATMAERERILQDARAEGAKVRPCPGASIPVRKHPSDHGATSRFRKDGSWNLSAIVSRRPA